MAIRTLLLGTGIALMMAGGMTRVLASDVCFSTHAWGSGASRLAFCVSGDGNLVQLESPQDAEHLDVGVTGEGYVLCSFEALHGYDAGFDESGFLESTVVQPNGPNTFPLTIRRDTSDGALRLTQTFTRDTTEKDVIITMAVRNRRAVRIRSVNVHRYFDGDIDGGGSDNLYRTGGDSVWAWKDGTDTHGLMLTARTFQTYHFQLVERYANWDPTAGGDASACPSTSLGDTSDPGNYVGRVGYALGDIDAGLSKTVTVLYSRF
jgi:hypothetical protein